MINVVVSAIFLALVLFYLLITPRICRKKIYSHIDNIGGQVTDIEKLTIREQLYCVYYTIDGRQEKAIVRFDLFYNSSWK